MPNLWERFESIVSTDEVADAKTQFAPLEEGEYKAILESIEPSENSNGLPMLKGAFKTIDSGRKIFYNQTLQNMNNPKMTAVNVAEAVAFVGGLLDTEIEFSGLGALANTVSEIPVGGVYTVKVTYGKKDVEQKFPKLKIVDKLADSLDMYESYVPVEADEEIPF